MNKLIIAIITIMSLILVQSVTKDNCTVITCSTTDVSSDTGVCATATKVATGNGYNINFQTCKSGFYCPNGFSIYKGNYTPSTANCIKDPNSSFWVSLNESISDLLNRDHCNNQAPGEACSVSNHCLSKNCTDKKCVGETVGKPCVQDFDCNKGLFCNFNTGKCANQKSENAECNRDEECINTHGCSNMKCIKYYSLGNGAEATNPAVCINSTIKIGVKPICDSRTLTTDNCAEDTCIYTYASDSSKSLNEGCVCDSSRKTNNVSCAAATIPKKTVYENVNTALRWRGSCVSDYIDYDSCVGEALFGSLYTNNSYILKIGFVFISILIVLF